MLRLQNNVYSNWRLDVDCCLQALSRAAEVSMHSFTEAPPVALPRDIEQRVGEGSDSQVLDLEATALPGALEVHLIRATHLEQVGVRPCWSSRPCLRQAVFGRIAV